MEDTITKISATEVNKLRQQTGAGLMDCKKALTEACGNFEEAIVVLRKKGQKIAASRVGKPANEGVIIAKTTPDNKQGILIELNCETDFVAKNKEFNAFANDIANAALQSNTVSIEELKSLKIGNITIADHLHDKMSKIGEKIDISYFIKIEGKKVVSYIHPGSKLGVLVAFNLDNVSEEISRDIAMQIAAMNPLGIDKDDIKPEIIAREKEIFLDQITKEGKPAQIAEKIAAGKLNKFFQESTLLNQQFIKDSSKTISQVLKDAGKDLKITAFKRKALGN